MNKREFLKILGLSGVYLAGSSFVPKFNTPWPLKPGATKKNWAWVTTDTKPTADEWKAKFGLMRQAGVDAVLLEIYNSHHAYYASKHLPVKELWLEQLLPLAKEAGLEAHAWMWSMPCSIEEILTKHPEWYVINGKGESAAVKPAYVDYYKFLCPTRPEVQDFIKTTVHELSQYDSLDGIHLDYIRFPDVILAETLQPKYGIVQDKEYPEYDYCYCEVCQKEFRKQSGIDILQLKDPSKNKEWRQFRYDRITHLVNDILVPVAHANKKLITAAVFPNWEMVRQQWPVWKLDAVLPMLYNNFYNKGIDWIKEQTEKGVASLTGRLPLYSGLFIPQLSPEDMTKAIEASYSGGARGIVLFSAQSMTDAHWKNFTQLIKK